MCCELLTKYGQRLGRLHVVWHVVPRSWDDNRVSPIGAAEQQGRRRGKSAT